MTSPPGRLRQNNLAIFRRGKSGNRLQRQLFGALTPVLALNGIFSARSQFAISARFLRR